MKHLNNGEISSRQGFRIGILENIALSMVLIPYVSINMAGDYQLFAFLLGLVIFGIYFALMMFFKNRLSKDFIDTLNEIGIIGKIISGIYLLRYLMRASLIILFFAQVVREYMIRSYTQAVIIVPFVLVCIYGALGGIERRGRMIEFLFLWMVVPLIFTAAFVTRSIDFDEVFSGNISGFFSENFTGNMAGVLAGAYMILLLLSNAELLMLNKSVRGNAKVMYSKIFVWICISLGFSYCGVVGILGRGFVASKNTAALNVMEAATFPGGLVARFDYPVLAFWIIGVFAVASGYIFWAKELAKGFVSKRKNYVLVLVILVLEIFLWMNKSINKIMAKYMIKIDLIISILLPVFVVLICKICDSKNVNLINKNSVVSDGLSDKKTAFRKKAGLICGIIFAVLLGAFRIEKYTNRIDLVSDMELSNIEKRSSVDIRDYAISLKIYPANNETSYEFTVANLADYSGDYGDSLESEEFIYVAKDINEARENYLNENGREIDLGHLDEIEICCNNMGVDTRKVFLEKYSYEYFEGGRVNEDTEEVNNTVGSKKEFITQIAKEFSQLPEVSKSVDTIINYGDYEEKAILRNVIKNAYSGEGL